MGHVRGEPAARMLVALVLSLVAFAPSAALPARAATAVIVIGDGLAPAALSVTPGTTVTWRNDSGNRHRMRSTSGPAEFDSGDLEPGQSFSFTFSTEGTWQYRDERNKELSNYWGTVTVVAAATPTPAPTPPPPPGATPAPTPAPPPGDVLMAGRAFNPRTLTVDAGTVVRWRNNDSREHTVTAGDRSFDSGLMQVGSTFVRTFTTPGTYAYLCLLHPDMTGTVAVRAVDGGAPPPPPAPTPTPRPTPAPTQPPGGVRIVDFAYSPASVDVVAGTTITWVNAGAALHTVTASDGAWDSGIIASGGTYQRRFGTAGTFPYLCALHPSMTGIVRVSPAGGGTPPPPAPPTVPPAVGSGELELRDFAFVPSSLRITPGTTVTWVNTGAAPHTVTDRAGTFDSGLLPRGARYSRRFPEAGTFRLLCTIHPEMHATLTVAAPGAAAPPPATPPPVPTPAPGSGEVAILDFDYSPPVLRVPVGTTVRWTNAGVAPHTVTANDGSFDSGLLATGEGFARTFTTEGSVEYLCAIHPAMIGTVVVGGSGTESGAPGSPEVPDASAGPPAEPGMAPAADPGDPGSGTGAGGGSGNAIAAEVPPGPLSVESVLRLALVLGIGLAAAVVFGGIIRSTASRT